MTHARATRDDRKGFASECDGELARHGGYDDVDYSSGVPRNRTVEVHFCLKCARVLALSEGDVLNVYEKPTMADVARDLAGRFGSGANAGRG